MKKSLLILILTFVAMSVWAAKIYVNPGHGSWHANCRHMSVIPYPVGSSDANGYYSGTDTLGFFESNTNLWKCFMLRDKLRAAGHTVKMSREASGGTNEQTNSAYDKALSVIAMESENWGADYFISVHSNAHSEGSTVNYPVYFYRGTDASNYVANSRNMCSTAQPHVYDIHAQGMEPASYTSPNIRGDISFWGTSLTTNGYTGYYGVLRHGDPGYLVEGYFHTYQPARHRAMNPDWCRQEGLRHYRGIAAWYGNTAEGKGYIMGYVRASDKQINQTHYTGRAGDDIYYPLNGAKIVLRNASGQIIKTDCYRHVNRKLKNQSYYTTDNYYNGVFVYEDLTPGTYTISVHKAGYADVKQTLTVTANKTTYTKVFMTTGTGTEPDVNEIQGTSGLNPYAYDLTSSWDSIAQKLTVKFSLNADAYVDGEGGYADGVQIYLSDDPTNPKKHYIHGLGKADCRQGQNKSFTIDLSSGLDKHGKALPLGKELYVSVTVQGDRSNTAPREYSAYHKVYCGHGIAVDKNPNSKNFGKIFVNEARQEEARSGELSGYFTKGLAGMYVIDPDFVQRSSTRYTGGNDFSLLVIENTYDGLARKGYQPWRVRVSEEGRIFVCSNDMHQRQATNAAGERDGVAVWEVDRNNFNNWTPVLKGYRRFVSGQTGTNYTFSYKDVNGVEQFIGPICGMDVKGTGDDLTLLLYTVNQAGIWLDMNGFRAYEYNVKSGALKPVNAFNNGGYGYVFEYTTLRYGVDGSYWFGGNRADGSDGVEGNGKSKEPNLGHVKLDGTTADYTNYNSEFYGGAGLINYKSTYNNATINGANHSWLITGKDNGGASDGYFDVFLVTSSADGGASVTRMDGNGGRPNWQKITASGMGRNLNDMAVDYAENLYIVSSSGGIVRAFAMPYCGEKTTVVRKEYTFSFPLPPVEEDSIAWHPYPAGYEVSNLDLWEQFAEDTVGKSLVDVLTGAESTWKWLGDYILTVDATIADATAWEKAVTDFFHAENAFATAGQPAGWEKLWWNATFPDTLANGATMPSVKRHGWALENWRYGNEDGYYYFGENSIVKDNLYDKTHKDSIDIWARWIEKCLYEGYETYAESGDTSAIDLRTWTLTANEDLLILISGTTTDVAIKRTLQKDVYNSLYLPFDLSKEMLSQWKDIEGNPAFDTMPVVYVYEADTVVLVDEKKELQLLFHELADDEVIKAGVPFLIQPKEDVAEKIYIESVYVTKGEALEVADGETTWVGEWQPENVSVSEEYHALLVAGGDTLLSLTETTQVLALSAYAKVPASVVYDYAVIKLPSEVLPEEPQPTIVWHPYPIGYEVSNLDLWEQFAEDTIGKSLVDMLTDAESTWKWLGEYIQTVDTTVADATAWEQSISDFFHAENAFATAGQPASWDSLWWNATFADTLAHGATMPNVKRHGWVLEGWRYGNEDGYYYLSEESHVLNNQYDTLKRDSTHLWCRWLEKRVSEGYDTYTETADTSAIDLREWMVNTNGDLVELLDGKMVDLTVTRTLIGDGYNAISLPFAVTEETIKQVTDAEGNLLFDAEQGGQEPTIYLYDLANVVVTSEADSELQIQLHALKEGETIAAHQPFVIKPQADVELNMVFHNVTIVKPEEVVLGVDDVQFLPQFVPGTVSPQDGNTLITISGLSTLEAHTEAVSISGLSGYFVVTPACAAYDYAVIQVKDGVTTGIHDINTSEKPIKVIIDNQVYILRGENVYSITGKK